MRVEATQKIKRVRTLIKLDYLPPSDDLKRYVSVYYDFTTDEADFHDIERADIAQLRFFLKGSGGIDFGNGVMQGAEKAAMFAPRSRATNVVVHGPAHLIGIGLLPAGWAALTSVPADKYANTVLDAASLVPGADDMWAKLGAAPDFAAAAALLNAWIGDIASRAQSVPHWFVREVDQWLESHLSPEVSQLAAATGLSQRQVERLTRQLYGIPPKLLVRKYRALRTANAIANGQSDWHDFVDECYYDQSHCIREVKEFVGITPAAIRETSSRLTTATFGRAKLAGQIAELSAKS